MLPGKWYAYDGDKKQYAEYNMAYSSPDTATQYPDDVEQRRKASCVVTAAYYLPAKGRQHHGTNFKALQPEWNTHNGNAEHKTADKIPQCTDEPAKNQPDDIT